jgi:hypothetical protein
MRFWWVNHKQPFRHEVENGYIWCPKVKKDGVRNHYYEKRLALSLFYYCNTGPLSGN